MGLKRQVRRAVAPTIHRICAKTIRSAFKIPAIRREVITGLSTNLPDGPDSLPGGPFRGNIPELTTKHLNDARLFANRNDLIASMRSIKGGVVAEVGVALGEFSGFLLNELQPAKFVAFDLFTLHEWGGTWRGKTSTDLLNNMTHLDYYRRKFASQGAQVVIEVGMSHLTLAKYPDKSFDLIYIDADHSYGGVKRDAELAKMKITDTGIIVFNDYIRFDHVFGEYYGVVQVVNELVVKNDNWSVYGFALQSEMYCDIAICKRSQHQLHTGIPGESLRASDQLAPTGPR